VADTIGSFIGNTVGEAAAFGAGIAVGPVLAPLLKALENEAWSQYPDAPLEAMLMAQAVLEGKVALADGQAEANLTGISNSRFNSLVTALGNAPSIAAAMELIRRGQLSSQQFGTILQRAGLEANWIAAYQSTSTNQLAPWETPLSPADLALGMVRNNLPNADSSGAPIFTPGLSSAGATVQQDPVEQIDVQAEAAMSGLDLDRFSVLARNVGLPPGVVEGLQMLRRGIINEADFALLIEQSDTRIAWGPALLQLQAAILTAHEAADLRLRGYINTDAMYYLGGLSGYSTGDMDLLLEDIGRPLPVHQITTGLERGGVFDGTDQTVPDPYLSSLEQSNIKPPWYSLAYANRYTYPGYFVLKALVADGGITTDQAATYLLYEGWEPELAALTAESFGGASGTTASTHVKSSQTALITATRKAYIAGAATPSDAQVALTAASVTEGDQASLLALWDAQKTIEGLVTPTTSG
jgi:hypothetical protein